MGTVKRLRIPYTGIVAVTGTWASTVGGASRPGHQLKTAAAETSVLHYEFSLPGDKNFYGAKLNSIIFPMDIITANLTGVATATLTQYNMWRSFTVPAQTFTANPDTDEITLATAGLRVGDAVQLSNSGGALPTGTATSTTYFFGAPNGLKGKLFATYAQAIAGDVSTNASAINFTDAGTGTHTITVNAPDVVTVPTTLSGGQVTAAAGRELVLTVNNPVFENTDSVGLKEVVSYRAAISLPCASGTVVRAYDGFAFYENSEN